MVEYPEFQALLLLLRRDLQDSMIPHRTKLHDLILESWSSLFAVLRKDLEVSLFPKLLSLDNSPVQEALGLISFTCNIWSNQIWQPFLAVTAHWMARVDETSALKLKTALIAFHPLSSHHTGELLACALIALLDRAKIMAKVSTTIFRRVSK